MQSRPRISHDGSVRAVHRTRGTRQPSRRPDRSLRVDRRQLGRQRQMCIRDSGSLHQTAAVRAEQPPPPSWPQYGQAYAGAAVCALLDGTLWSLLPPQRCVDGGALPLVQKAGVPRERRSSFNSIAGGSGAGWRVAARRLSEAPPARGSGPVMTAGIGGGPITRTTIHVAHTAPVTG